jgi:hypothetical protein
MKNEKRKMLNGPRSLRLPFCILHSVFCICLFTGCGGPNNQTVSLPIWQQHVEQYVHDFGKDDPTSLRDLTIPDGRKGFAVNGSPLPKDSTDAVGLLLAHRPVDGRPAFIYLVGIVDKEKLTDIRLAMLTFDNGKSHWHVSPANAGALETYRRSHPSTAGKESVQNFPAANDVFNLDVAGGRVTAVHAPSGASWTVTSASAAGHG